MRDKERDHVIIRPRLKLLTEILPHCFFLDTLYDLPLLQGNQN